MKPLNAIIVYLTLDTDTIKVNRVSKLFPHSRLIRGKSIANQESRLALWVAILLGDSERLLSLI
jgi:hypothetical protein